MNKQQIETRVEQIMEKMTLREMIDQLDCYSSHNGDARLGVGQINVCEALHGVCLEGATSFPQALSLAATWNPDLVRRVGAAIAQETRAYDVHMVFAPMLALAQDARWGRVEESFGEDPVLVSEMGCAYVEGMQGTGDEQYDENHVMCVAKHFVADGATAKGINGAPVELCESTLRETHMKPFEAVVRRAGVGGIMPAHHSLNRVPCHANDWLLGDVLRKDWGFDGVVVSDMMDIPKIYAVPGDANDDDFHQHRVAQSVEEAGYLAVRAGVDMELGEWCVPFENRVYGEKLYEGIVSGRFANGEEYVRRACRQALIAKFRLGLTDAAEAKKETVNANMEAVNAAEDAKFWAKAMKKGLALPGTEHLRTAEEAAPRIDFEAHAAIAREAAEEAIILLKNEGNLLPLDRKAIKSLAVIGENAELMRLGGYSTPAPRRYVNVVDGLKEYLGADVEVRYARGCVIDPHDNEYGDEWEERKAQYIEGLDEAVSAAKESDVALMVLGGNRELCGENTDADEISLTWAQRKLLRAVYETGKPVVLLLIGGRPNAIPWEKDHIPAILQSFYLGQETGNVVARTLFGDICPSGKLPMAVPRRASHIPVLYNALYWGSPKSYVGAGMPATPLYPFGFGLSYTTFELSGRSISAEEMGKDDTAVVSVRVKNTGDRAGSEVVQLYIRDDFGSLVRPVREMKAFQKVALEPGEERTVEFPVGWEELKFFKDGQWIVEDGTFTIYIGTDAECTEHVTLTVRG